jgi:Chitobiase/beta-hexosaminidase C-terminal domain/Bacterial Ig-like domain (group 2)/Glucodextranase, domain B
VSVSARRPTIEFALAATLLLSIATRAESLTVTALTPSVSYPLVGGTPVSWTATVSGASGSVEYKFFMYQRTSWVLMQDYGASNVFAWTPQAADAGTPNYVQVWVRALGSTASYDAYLSTDSFDVLAPPIALTASVDFPTPPNNTVTWTASTSAVTSPEYEFRVLDQSTSAWSVFRAYATSGQAQWTPQVAGNYVVQVRARTVGSSVDYDKAVSTPTLSVSTSTPLTLTSFATATAFPAPTGTPITWTARAKGGSAGPLQHQVWRVNTQSGTWTNVQPYGPSSIYTWTPTWADGGEYSLQVWVRNAGSTASYDAWRSTDTTFQINRASVQLTTTTQFPTYARLPIVWTAHVPDASVTFQYQFWVYSSQTGQWTLGRDYGTSETFTWTPTTAGNYRIQAWARQTGSTASYDVYSGTDLFEITNPVITATPAGGAYNTTQSVTLQGPTGTTIRYTTNGSTPTSSSPIYTNPITVSTSQTLRAKTFQGTWIDNYEVLESYVIDSTLPVIVPTYSPPPNATSWNDTPVTVTFTCSDALSGVAVCPDAITFAADASNQAFTVTARDQAGNVASLTGAANVDRTPPLLTINSPSSDSTTSATTATVTLTATDALSGVAEVTCNGVAASLSGSAGNCTVPVRTGLTDVVIEARDRAGNRSSASVRTRRSDSTSTLLISPASRTMLIGETVILTAVDQLGRPPDNITWTIDNSSIAAISTGAGVTLTANAAGSVTVTANWQGLSATSNVTVLSAASYSPGQVQWSMPPLGGDAIQTWLYPRRLVDDDPDIFAIERATSSNVFTVRALAADGQELWRTRSYLINARSRMRAQASCTMPR